jgi:proton-translocating NAD(P)+ transhydrogenase subunit alpha
MIVVGVVKETYPGERRVALTPSALPALAKAGVETMVEPGAGGPAGYPDTVYAERGARIAVDRAEVFRSADVIVQVRGYGANPERGRDDLALLRRGQVLIATFEPLTALDEVKAVADRGVTLFALELVPRITRAQSMDVLSSQATIAGYKAVLLAAAHAPRMFPMMMTAAGTIPPAKVFIIGAGVAGLQAIATAKRLGSVVHAYDVRAAVKEQIESLGAKFVQIAVESAEGTGGYAKAMDQEFYRKQRELLTAVVAQSEIVITTAAVPGAKPPLLLTADMVRGMPKGSVIVDLAARRGQSGGNCELTRPDEWFDADGVLIHGPTNLPATIPQTASPLFAKNVVAFLSNLLEKGELRLDRDDEIVRQTLTTREGQVVHAQVKERLGALVGRGGAS